MTYLRIALQKNLFIDSLIEHFKKIMKIPNISIFSFIIFNLVKKFGPLILLQPLTYVWKK